MKNTRKRPAGYRDTILLLSLFLLVSGFWGGLKLKSKVAQGNEAFERGEYDKALGNYIEAEDDERRSPLLRYNIGCVLYQQSRIKEAEEEFNKALNGMESTKQARRTRREAELRHHAVFNRGNCLVHQKRLKEALESYKDALRIDPSDMNTKHNLEFVLKLMEQQDEEEPPPSSSEDQEEQQDSEDDQSQKPQDQPEEEKEQSQDDQDGRDRDSQPQPQPFMTQDEALRILDALEQSQANDFKEWSRKEIKTGPSDPEIDW
ncbi:tetratricopeptide repeat protein [Acidobacteriota bacterium]